MEKELTTLNYEDKGLLKTIADTVARGATQSEFNFFIEYCKSTGLNPIKKEIWFIKTSRGLQIMTGINGFLAIANRNETFDGITTEIFEKDGKLDRIVASVWRKDRKHPAQGTAILSEYQQNTPIWKEKPFTMLEKVAKARALREAFSQELNGIYSVDEYPIEENAITTQNLPTVEATFEEEEERFIYDLSNMEEERRVKVLDFLKNKNVKIENVGGEDIVISKRKYNNIEEFRIDEVTLDAKREAVKEKTNSKKEK